MNRKLLILIVCLTAGVPQVSGQSRSKRVKQPREVVEAFRVCTEFRRLLAEDFDFDRAFEATFVKDPARRREIAIAETNAARSRVVQVDTDTLVTIYKDRVQLLILVLPLTFAGDDDTRSEFLPPSIEETFQRKPPNDAQQLPAYAAQFHRDVADFRAHVEKLAKKYPDVAKMLAVYKTSLLQPLVPPNHVVRPLTAYSHGRVLPVNAKYYQIDDCAVIREAGQMRLIGYTFFQMRW